MDALPSGPQGTRRGTVRRRLPLHALRGSSPSAAPRSKASSETLRTLSRTSPTTSGPRACSTHPTMHTNASPARNGTATPATPMSRTRTPRDGLTERRRSRLATKSNPLILLTELVPDPSCRVTCRLACRLSCRLSLVGSQVRPRFAVPAERLHLVARQATSDKRKGVGVPARATGPVGGRGCACRRSGGLPGRTFGKAGTRARRRLSAQCRIR